MRKSIHFFSCCEQVVLFFSFLQISFGLSFIDSESLVTYIEDSPRAGPDISVWNGSLEFLAKCLKTFSFAFLQ